MQWTGDIGYHKSLGNSNLKPSIWCYCPLTLPLTPHFWISRKQIKFPFYSVFRMSSQPIHWLNKMTFLAVPSQISDMNWSLCTVERDIGRCRTDTEDINGIGIPMRNKDKKTTTKTAGQEWHINILDENGCKLKPRWGKLFTAQKKSPMYDNFAIWSLFFFSGTGMQLS